MTKESQRAIATLMALIQTTKNADIIHSLRYAIEAIHHAEKYQDMKSRLNPPGQRTAGHSETDSIIETTCHTTGYPPGGNEETEERST